MSIWQENKKISCIVVLPNLRYKNDNIYFISKNPIKVKINNKIEFTNEFIIKDIALNGNITCMNTYIECEIIPKEFEDGIHINMKFIDNCDIYTNEIQKFARAIESKILGIDIMDDCEYTSNPYDNIIYDNKYGGVSDEESDEESDEKSDEKSGEKTDDMINENSDTNININTDINADINTVINSSITDDN